MKIYQISRIDRAGSVMMLIGFLIYAISWLEFIPKSFNTYAFWLAMSGLACVLLTRLFVMVTMGNIQFPTTPQGFPVEPTEIWVTDETPLEIGTRVLAELERIERRDPAAAALQQNSLQ